MAKAKIKVGPWLPAKYTVAEVAAIQAMHRGDADEYQQKCALRWIIESAARAGDELYFPTDADNDGRRDTDYALGKRYVGNQIIKLTLLDLKTLKDQDEAKLPAISRQNNRLA